MSNCFFLETSFISRCLETLDPHTALLLKFTVKNLLESEHFDSLTHFADIFQSLEQKVPGLVPPLGLALCKLSQQSLSGQSTAGDELNLAQQTRFFNSKIFQSFLKARCAAQVQAVRGMNKADQGERLAKVKELLLLEQISAEDKLELQEVVTLLGPADLPTKMCYLMADVRRFEVLRQWCPEKERLLNLEVFAQILVGEKFESFCFPQVH